MTTIIILTAWVAYLTLPQTEQTFCLATPLCYRGTGRIKGANAACQRGSERLGSAVLGAYRASERG